MFEVCIHTLCLECCAFVMLDAFKHTKVGTYSCHLFLQNTVDALKCSIHVNSDCSFG